MGVFLSSFTGMAGLTTLLHGPVLDGNGSIDEVLPVRLLRQFASATHVRSPYSSIAGFLGQLPSISAAGLAAPAAKRLVRPELQAEYNRLAKADSCQQG